MSGQSARQKNIQQPRGEYRQSPGLGSQPPRSFDWEKARSPRTANTAQRYPPRKEEESFEDDFDLVEHPENNDDEYYDEDEEQPQTSSQDNNAYFQDNRGNNIINQRMVRYEKRRLPSLQRYNPNSHRDSYAEFNQAYWDDDNQRPDRYRERINWAGLWQKFIVTFASILSLVCISWIAYNWHSNASSNNGKYQQQRFAPGGIPIVEPNQSAFKVLPDSPGGAEIAYTDKTIYNEVDRSLEQRQSNSEESLLPPQNETFAIPNQEDGISSTPEEYSIVDDKTYYIRISAGKDKQVLLNEAKLLRKKFATLFAGKECSVKRVSNLKGEQRRAILIGPYDSQQSAVETAREIGQQCYVISVKE